MVFACLWTDYFLHEINSSVLGLKILYRKCLKTLFSLDDTLQEVLKDTKS